MPEILVRPRSLRYLPGALLLTVSIASCGAQPAGPTAPASTTQTGTATQLVVGRSSKPADVGAPGIQMPSGSTFSVSIGSYNLVIKASDWNTIVSSSQVANLIGVEFAPDFNTTDNTTRNRFQYLADEISQHYTGTHFEPLSIVASVSNSALVDDAALYNATDQVGKLSGLMVTVTNNTSGGIVASGTFYGTPASAVIISARTVYFVRLTFSSASIGPANNGMNNYTVSFHWSQFGQFAPCPGQVCSS